MRGTERRNTPLGRWRSASISPSASVISPVAERRRRCSCAPASVSATLRVVRRNSGMPTRASSALTAWLTAAADTRSCAAAERKLPCSATAMNSVRPEKTSMRAMGLEPDGILN
jgi:hypothetical protein